MVRLRKLILCFALIAAAASAQIVSPTLPPPASPVISDPSDLVDIYDRSMGVWINSITPFMYEIFAALAGLQFAFLGWRLWKQYRGDITSTMTGLADQVLVTGLFLTLMLNGPTWVGWIINSFATVGKAVSGTTALSPSVILLQGFQIFGGMFAQALKNGLFLNLSVSLALIFAGICVFLAFVAITFQFVVTKVLAAITIGVGCIFLGFGGSSWTDKYVERYLALAVSTGVKLMVLYIMVGTGWNITNNWITQANSVGFMSSAVDVAFLIAAGSMMYAGMVWSVSKIVSSWFSGGISLTHSDIYSIITTGIAGAVGVGGAIHAAGAASAARAASARSASQSAAAGGGSPSGHRAAQPSAPGALVAGISAATNAAARMPHGGSPSPPPSLGI